jgi:kumamolisin
MANAARGGPLGFVNSALYANPPLFRQIIQGNNRVSGKGYDAGAGWNACTGLGVPQGADIIAALAAVPVAQVLHPEQSARTATTAATPWC